tara:strand:+ start:22419 stop:24023 length:1605 start_codon:yes stop_codon:yes gene_type:complete
MNNRENIEQMLARNELDFITSDEALSLIKNNKCGKITVTSGGITTTPFDTIELLILTESLDQTRRSLVGYAADLRTFTPMYQDFFVLTNTRQYARARSNNMGIDGYCTLGAGIYYRRTNYTINEDEEYFYITTKFDIYTNTVLDTVTNFYNDGYSEAYFLLPTTPRFLEEDSEWSDFRASLVEAQTTTSSQRNRTGITNNYRNHNRLRQWLHENRFPRIRAHATDTNRDTIVRTEGGLTTCVAIKKFKYTAPTRAILNQNPIRSTGWVDFGSMSTFEIRQGFFNDRNTKNRIGQQTLHSKTVTTNTFSKRKNNKMFNGIFDESGRYTIANIVCTDPGVDDEELLRLLKSKVATNIYPETNKKVLLNANAFLKTYTDGPLEEHILKLPGIMGSELFLWREGDFDGTQAGSTLTDYGQIEDGVYKIRLSHSSTLRRDKKVAKMNNGIYRVCIDSNVDIIQYVDTVSNALAEITVEANRGRLTMDSGASQTLRVSRRNRTLSTTESTSELPTKKIGVRRSARRIFGDFLRKESLEEE